MICSICELISDAISSGSFSPSGLLNEGAAIISGSAFNQGIPGLSNPSIPSIDQAFSAIPEVGSIGGFPNPSMPEVSLPIASSLSRAALQEMHPDVPWHIFSTLDDDIYNEELPIPMTFKSDAFNEKDREIAEMQEKMMAEEHERNEKQKIKIQTIESHAFDTAFDEPIRLSDERETMHIKRINEEKKFALGEKVFAWKSIRRNVRGRHALIGITNTSVQLLHESNGQFVLSTEIPMLSRPCALTTFTRYNSQLKSIEGIVIVGTEQELVFLRVTEELDTMAAFWLLPIHQSIVAMETFTIHGQQLLMMLNDDPNHPTAHLYRIEIDAKSLWLRESISLTVSTKSFAFIETHADYFIVFAQLKSARVFKYVDERFQFWSEIDGENLNVVSTFEMGGYAYIAVGGNRPRFLRFTRGDFQEQIILAPSWGIVEEFLPIPAHTYRDDLIVIVQHRIEFETHSVSVLETLIWNGDAFDPVYSIPCFIDGQPAKMGLQFMIDDERQDGIRGATTFQNGNHLSILIPRHQAPSGLFNLEYELLPAEFQYDEELLQLFSETLVMLDTREDWLNDARAVVDAYEAMQNDEIDLNGFDFDEISTDEIEIDSMKMPTENIYFGNEKIDASKMSEFSNALNETNKLVANVKNDRKKREANVVHRNDLNVDELSVQFINDISIDDFVFATDGEVELDGDLVLEQPIEFEKIEKSDDANLGNSDEDVIDKLEVWGDFSFEEINGLPWRELVDQIVFKNEENDLPDLIVKGVRLSLLFSNIFSAFIFTRVFFNRKSLPTVS